MSGNSKIKIPIQTLAFPQRHGGFNVANITLYADLFLLRQIRKYCKHRSEETPTTPNLAYWTTDFKPLPIKTKELLSTYHQTQHNIRLLFSDNQTVPFHL